LSWILSENEEIIKVIEKFFDAGKTKNLSQLREIHLDDARFSSFSDKDTTTTRIPTNILHLQITLHALLPF